MDLFDVNVLIYAFDSGSLHHAACLDYLEQARRSTASFGMLDLVTSSVVRLSTQSKVVNQPGPTADAALDFCNMLRSNPNCVIVHPGPRCWPIFDSLCRVTKARKDVVPDAYFAAIALEAGCTWVTCDGDFAKFPGLTWRHLPDGQLRTNPT